MARMTQSSPAELQTVARYDIGGQQYTAGDIIALLGKPGMEPTPREILIALDSHPEIPLRRKDKTAIANGAAVDLSASPEVAATILRTRFEINSRNTRRETPGQRGASSGATNLEDEIIGGYVDDDHYELDDHVRSGGSSKRRTRAVGIVAAVALVTPGVASALSSGGSANTGASGRVNAFINPYVDGLMTITDFITGRKPATVRPVTSSVPTAAPIATKRIPSATASLVPGVPAPSSLSTAGNCENQLAATAPEKLIAQTIMIPINGDGTSKDGKTSAPAVQAIIEKYDIGGVIVMTAPNQTFPTFVNPSNFDVPLVVAINQEGGSVRRIKDGASANFPSAADMAKKSDAEITQIVRSVAKQLKAAGINTNFAPVLDISPADGSTVKFGESRVFGSDPAQAARLGDLFAKAMLQEGVNPVYKHFGGGSMDSNTDLAPASVPTMGQLKSRDFQPYKTVSKTPQTGLMLGSFKPSDGATNGQPANQSKLFYDLAINTYGFTGPLFTDDIGTKAAGGKLNIDFIDALQAGATMPLYVQDPSSQILENQILGIIKEGTDALNAHTLSREQLAKAVSRNAAAIGLNACQVATGLNN